MEYSEMITALRSSVGMNRKQFCDYLEIPYRTMSDWEAGLRTMPPYVYSLIEYKVKTDLSSEKDLIKSGNSKVRPRSREEKEYPNQAIKAEKKKQNKAAAITVINSDSAELTPPVKDEPPKKAFIIDNRYDSMPWITKEDNLLKEMYSQGKCLEEMSEKLQRSPEKIAARLKKLNCK